VKAGIFVRGVIRAIVVGAAGRMGGRIMHIFREWNFLEQWRERITASWERMWARWSVSGNSKSPERAPPGKRGT
jgi:hypothetical protein